MYVPEFWVGFIIGTLATIVAFVLWSVSVAKKHRT